MAILVTGSRGFVGKALTQSLQQDGQPLLRLVRRPALLPDEVASDPVSGRVDGSRLTDVTAAVHLAGENVAGRWTKAKKQAIFASRVLGTEHLCRALAALEQPPEVLVAASAIGFYGDRTDHEVDERNVAGHGFLAEVCQQWEAATRPASDAGIRVVHLRLGIVLGRGGALARMLLPFRLGLGGPIGSGKQWMSWVALADVVGAIRFAIQHRDLHGPVNATAPTPVTNREFAQTLGRALHRPACLPTPGFVLRALYGGFADEALLTGARVLPRVLTSSGFAFQQPTLAVALAAALA